MASERQVRTALKIATCDKRLLRAATAILQTRLPCNHAVGVPMVLGQSRVKGCWAVGANLDVSMTQAARMI